MTAQAPVGLVQFCLLEFQHAFRSKSRASFFGQLFGQIHAVPS
jgi:hypothetical protein